jgi:hypothetical protein
VSNGIFLFALLLLFGCSRTEYSFERIDGDKAVALPLKFDGLYGVRDGAAVKTEGYFADGADVVAINMNLYLRPPAEFQSGSYQAVFGGKMTSGRVDCLSLIFQGGQTALPSVGGVFILNDDQNRPLYRVSIPATPLRSTRTRGGGL